jgi:hypothetical protein
MMNVSSVEAEPADQLYISLDEDDAAHLRIKTVGIVSGKMRVNFAPIEASELTEVLHPAIAQEILRICSVASGAKHLLSKPDFMLRAGGAVLHGYALLVSTDESGKRSFNLRFRKLTGTALAIFRTEIRTSGSLAVLNDDAPRNLPHMQASTRLYDQMLSELYVPLANLTGYLKQTSKTLSEEQQPCFQGSVAHLKARAELLQHAFDRLITEMTLDVEPLDAANNPSSPRPLPLPAD